MIRKIMCLLGLHDYEVDLIWLKLICTHCNDVRDMTEKDINGENQL